MVSKSDFEIKKRSEELTKKESQALKKLKKILEMHILSILRKKLNGGE
jgi:hypothetical protein